MRRLLATSLTALLLVGGIVAGGPASPVSAAVSAADETPSAAALAANGVVMWGAATRPPPLSDAVAVSAGGFHSLALRAAGTVVAWGPNDDYGQLSVPDGLTDATAIDAGRFHNLAVRGNGTVVAWGLDNYGQREVPDGLEDVVSVAAGVLQSLALRSDGTVVGWGEASSGATVPEELTVPSAENPVTAIAAGAYHSLALRKDGTVVAWGNGVYGQRDVPADLTDAVAISAGDLGSIAVRRDGTVVAWGTFPAPPADLSDVTAVAAGSDHGLALREDGTVVAWGGNSQTQLDIPGGVTDARAIAAGNYYSLALGPVPEFTADAPPTSGTVGVDYSYGFAASGPALRFEGLAGEFPAGLTISSDGVLSGTPTTAGDSTFRVVARNVYGGRASAEHTVSIATAAVPTITGRAPDGTVGVGYASSYTVTGAPAPTVTVLSGTLPTGLTLSASGNLTGTPTAAGTSTFTVQAASSAGTAQLTDSITVAAAAVAPSVSGVAAAGIVGAAYDYAYTVSGTPSPTVTLRSGTLPPGLALDGTGRLSGTPTAAGAYAFTVQATSPAGTATASSTVTVSPQKAAAKADMRVDLSAPASAVKGTTFTYTLITRNAGPAASTSVFSKVILPPGVQFVSATGKYTRIGSVVVFQRSSLADGQTATERITVKAVGAGRAAAVAATFSARTPDPSITSNADTTATTLRSR